MQSLSYTSVTANVSSMAEQETTSRIERELVTQKKTVLLHNTNNNMNMYCYNILYALFSIKVTCLSLFFSNYLYRRGRGIETTVRRFYVYGYVSEAYTHAIRYASTVTHRLRYARNLWSNSNVPVILTVYQKSA